MTIKEAFDVSGLPTTWGEPAQRNNLVRDDATVVERLMAAGAHFMGKTNVPLRLADWQSYNDIYGTTNNPWDTERSPGGSSGGSAAALAAGLTGLELGSDVGGSIRNRSHFCGVYGHKPTDGIVPPTLRSVAALSGPMGEVARLDPSLRNVAALGDPMSRVAGLDPTLRAVADLDGPMTRLVSLGPRLDAVAGLGPALGEVAALDSQLASVAALEPSLRGLGELRQPLERVAALEEPMARLAALGSLFDRPGRFVLYGALALVAWGIVTFLAVRFAIVSAARRTA
jgi:Asp-tRNA(Asn)/Glu-tRNA(Gln) amidotransferase A subunit family amidase